MIVVPFCSLVPAVIIAHTLVGPIGWTVGNAIAEAVNWGLTSDVRILFAAVFGALYAPVVMTGLHHMTNAIDTQMVNVMGYTILWPMIALSNIAQGSAVLAMSVLQKKNERAQQVNVPACISCYLGVTEPALFGVNLKYRFPLVCGMIGSACAAVLCTGLGVQALSIGVGGLPGILSIKFEYWIAFALCMAAAIVVPFVLTFVAGKKKLTKVELGWPRRRCRRTRRRCGRCYRRFLVRIACTRSSIHRCCRHRGVRLARSALRRGQTYRTDARPRLL